MKSSNNQLLAQLVENIVTSVLKEEYDLYNPSLRRSGVKHYKINVPKKLQKPTRVTKPVVNPFETNIDDEHKDFVVDVLKSLPRNQTAQKILHGQPITKKEVYLLAKALIQAGMIPQIRHFKTLARVLAGIAFEIQQK